MPIFGERHLHRLLAAYVAHDNTVAHRALQLRHHVQNRPSRSSDTGGSGLGPCSVV
jgi:hypothetical protein